MAENKETKAGFFSRLKTRVGSIVKYFRDTVSEMKKVVWPSRKQVLNNTLVVAVVVILAALVIFLLDTVFGFALDMILSLGA